jgi:integrase
MFKALGFVLRAAKLERLININPFENVKRISVPDKIYEYLNAEELEALAKTPLAGNLGAEIRRAFIFACYTGLRIGDLRSLAWGQIIRVPAPRIQKRQGKTGRIVSIPLSPAAWEIIKTDNLFRHDTPVFPLLTTRTDTNKYILQWAERAKIEKHIGWHTARRTFATLAMEAGADVSTVSRLLGHSGIQVTAIYAQSTDKAKRQAVDALPKINLKEAK